MIRILFRLLGIKDFETCKSCETLRQQLEYSNREKRELTETLLSLIQPKIIQSNPIHVPDFKKSSVTFSRLRQDLEREHAKRDDIRNQSPFLAKPSDSNLKETAGRSESVDEMEKRLGLDSEVG